MNLGLGVTDGDISSRGHTRVVGAEGVRRWTAPERDTLPSKPNVPTYGGDSDQ